MGDRCYLQICVHKKDVAKAIAFGEGCLQEDGREHGECCWLEEEQAHPWETLDVLTAAGIRFYGSHGAGCAYGPFTFVCDGKERVECPCGFETDEPMVSVGHIGINLRELDHARKYWRMMAETLALFDPKTAAEGRKR
jgi:hypothetical protein